MTSTPKHDVCSKAAQDILSYGYAVVQLSDVDSGNLHRAIGSAVKFFQRPLEYKLAHGSSDHNYGYRPYGKEYGITPERPDMNEVFTFWSDRVGLIPNAQDIPELTSSCLDFRGSLTPLVKGILDVIAKNFGAEAAPAFERAAHLQINYCFPTPLTRDLLQDKHEDGHMVTVLYANAPGLEIYTEGRESETALPVSLADNEVVVMPGSALTALTGGAIPPLYHHVRNHGLDNRQSIMYFVNPEIGEPLYSWVESAEGERIDICKLVQNAPLSYGLPPVQAL